MNGWLRSAKRWTGNGGVGNDATAGLRKNLTANCGDEPHRPGGVNGALCGVSAGAVYVARVLTLNPGAQPLTQQRCFTALESMVMELDAVPVWDEGLHVTL